MKTETIKLADRGTAGLVEYAINGSPKLYGARLDRAQRIIFKRYGREAMAIFTNVCNRDVVKLWNAA
jgi:hypothetical protein